jgi:chitodextrinase
MVKRPEAPGERMPMKVDWDRRGTGIAGARRSGTARLSLATRVACLALLGLSAAALSGCGGKSPKTTVPPAGDSTAPARVADLRALAVTDSSITLAWTAPGDDGASGDAATYDLRYAPGDSAHFVPDSAIRVALPAPAGAGAAEGATVSGLPADSLFTFSLRTADEVPNWSPVSRRVTTRTAAPPPPPPPPCSVEPDTLEFGPIPATTTLDHAFVIRNGGSVAISGRVTLESECGAFLLVDDPADYQLEPGASDTVRVRFAPAIPGGFSCLLDAGGECGPVTCLGVASAPPPPPPAICSVSPTALDFGTIGPGETKDLRFTIRNTGGSVLAGTFRESCAGYDLLAGSPTYHIAAGESLQVVVRFHPANAGIYPCTVETGSILCPDVTCTGTVAGLRGEDRLDR